MRFVATCLFGLESFLGKEIDELGFKRLSTLDGRVIFEGDISTIVKANLYLRTAERVLILLSDFDAYSFEELFENTKMINWSNYIGKNDAFPVKGHSIKSKLVSIPDCQKIIKKAIVSSLSNSYNISWFEETGTKYQIDFFILKDHVYLMIDTSGEALHKRGYRPISSMAPLRETLACALAKISRPRDNVLFWDPMCGSGTIAIEAALLMTNTPPGINRTFAYEDFDFVEKRIKSDEIELAKSKIIRTDFRCNASDIDENNIEIAKTCAKNAGVDDIISIFKQNALDIKTGGVRGTIVCNPPYGERLVTIKEAQELYKKMGAHFKTLDSWQIYILTNNEEFEKYYGKKADKKRKLYNGMIPCILYEYFKGKEKQQ